MTELKLTDQIKMPLYQCHKQVRAAVIYSMVRGGCEGLVELNLNGVDEPMLVEKAWVLRHNPQVGGYYIMYEDGYASYSPADVFEKGYTEVVGKISDE